MQDPNQPTAGAQEPGALPLGCVLLFAGVDIPRGWLLCDGTAVSRELYPHLFALLGTSHGSGNGSTTFQIPNLQGPSSSLRYIIKAE